MPSSFQTPTKSEQQVSKALLAFYQNPVAQVSTELFLTIGAVVFFAIFAIRPTILTMTDLIKEIDDKKVIAEALSKKVATLSSVQLEYFALQNQFPLLDEVIPPEPDSQKVLKIIEKVAAENQLAISTINFKEVPLKDTRSTLAFRQKQPVSSDVVITATGSYSTIRTFLQQLLSVRPLMTLDELSINKESQNNLILQTDQKGPLTVTFHLKTHYYGKGVEVVAPTTQPAAEPSL